MSSKVVDSVFWFRRDLRLEDNHGLFNALSENKPVLPIFIFDTNILLDLLDRGDKRVQFIYQELTAINERLKKYDSAIHCFYGDPVQIFRKLHKEFDFKALYANEDYEPYGQERDKQVALAMLADGVKLNLFKDHVLCRPGEVLKDNQTPYTIYTPYMKKWKEVVLSSKPGHFPSERLLDRFVKNIPKHNLDLKEIGFEEQPAHYPSRTVTEEVIKHYSGTRNFPAQVKGTSHLGIHLRFGTISIRRLYHQVESFETTFLNELIWREFFIQILFFHPRVIHSSFKPAYDQIQWRNDPKEFKAWCTGKTGYAMVDAGMRELNATGFMHNRVRMVTASFLCKHLLIDWRWGEAYFAGKLLDYDLASNNGNWQWAAGTGCDAAPYFRIFNPHEQLKKFDPQLEYVLKWAPEYGEIKLPPLLVDHAEARARALAVYGQGLKSN